MSSQFRFRLGVTAAVLGAALIVTGALMPPPADATPAAPAANPTAHATAIPVSAVYPSSRPGGRVVLFLSGDGGWNLGVVDMARMMADAGYTVAGIDWPAYLRQRDTGAACLNLSEELLATASAVQRDHAASHAPPLIVGYSSGATAAYAAIAQAHDGAFGGAMSLGFGPDLLTKSPFCRGTGLTAVTDPKLGFIYRARPAMTTRWVALQGEMDQVVSPSTTRAFVAQIPSASVISLPKVGHGFSVQSRWAPQLLAAARSIAPAQTGGAS